MSSDLAVRKKLLTAGTVLICAALVIISIGIGSVRVSPYDTIRIIFCKTFGRSIPSDISDTAASIIWSIRLPRVLTAFLSGAALAASGVVMQAVLQNPLASSYTLGVSSGASLGAAIVIVMDISIPVLGAFLLPTVGFGFGLATVLLVLALSSRMDHSVQTHTVILIGMVVSLFVNAILTLVASFAGDKSQQLLQWQMGSFNARRWYHVLILLPVVAVGIVLLLRKSRELDIMSFGDEQAFSIGVDVPRSKKYLLVLATLLTGFTVCFSGVIGFVDLVTPHVIRRLFGASHRTLIPMAMVTGGAFMAICDMFARTLLAPRELPIGAITALIGAPFFVWIYFRGQR